MEEGPGGPLRNTGMYWYGGAGAGAGAGTGAELEARTVQGREGAIL